MRKSVFALVLAIALLALSALASTAAAAVRVYVSPTSGGPTTKFVVHFRAPSATGSALHRRYELYASGPRGSRCTSSVARAIGSTGIGSRVRVTLTPGGRGGTWCAGKFRGRIVEYISSVCEPMKTAIICPEIVIAPQTIGRFSFSVRKAGSSSTGSGTGTQGGPTFAGLQRATYCETPGPPSLATKRYYMLSWSPATDPLTPSPEIVYDIYYSSTSGGEDFSTPTATTAAGATSYEIAIPALGSAFFVVRARDTAGHEDSNTVQRQALNFCTNS